jgi:hypothetical protein
MLQGIARSVRESTNQALRDVTSRVDRAGRLVTAHVLG